jgi:hypothetical protein
MTAERPRLLARCLQVPVGVQALIGHRRIEYRLEVGQGSKMKMAVDAGVAVDGATGC